MALIVSTSKAVIKGGKLRSTSETLVFENEDEGRKYVEQNKTWVIHSQKARLINE